MASNSCDGCAGAEGGWWCPVKAEFGVLYDCPCSNCLVKVLCAESCQKWISYHSNKKKKGE